MSAEIIPVHTCIACKRWRVVRIDSKGQERRSLKLGSYRATAPACFACHYWVSRKHPIVTTADPSADSDSDRDDGPGAA